MTMLPLQTQNKLLLSTCQLLSSGGNSLWCTLHSQRAVCFQLPLSFVAAIVCCLLVVYFIYLFIYFPTNINHNVFLCHPPEHILFQTPRTNSLRLPSMLNHIQRLQALATKPQPGLFTPVSYPLSLFCTYISVNSKPSFSQNKFWGSGCASFKTYGFLKYLMRVSGLELKSSLSFGLK